MNETVISYCSVLFTKSTNAAVRIYVNLADIWSRYRPNKYSRLFWYVFGRLVMSRNSSVKWDVRPLFDSRLILHSVQLTLSPSGLVSY
jgi:hypothetical protein